MVAALHGMTVKQQMGSALISIVWFIFEPRIRSRVVRHLYGHVGSNGTPFRQRTSLLHVWFVTGLAVIIALMNDSMCLALVVVVASASIVWSDGGSSNFTAFTVRKALVGFTIARHVYEFEAMCVMRRSNIVRAISSHGSTIDYILTVGVLKPIIIIAYGRLLCYEVTEVSSRRRHIS